MNAKIIYEKISESVQIANFPHIKHVKVEPYKKNYILRVTQNNNKYVIFELDDCDVLDDLCQNDMNLLEKTIIKIKEFLQTEYQETKNYKITYTKDCSDVLIQTPEETNYKSGFMAFLFFTLFVSTSAVADIVLTENTAYVPGDVTENIDTNGYTLNLTSFGTLGHTIYGTGQLEISANVWTLADKLQTNTVLITGGASPLTLTGGTLNTYLNGGIVHINGNVSSSADYLLNVRQVSIQNNGTLILTDGEIIQTFIEGVGTTEIAHDLIADVLDTTNGWLLPNNTLQTKIKIDEGYTLTLKGGQVYEDINGEGTLLIDGHVSANVDLLNSAAVIVNEGQELSLTGGTIDRVITGNGTTELAYDLSMNADTLQTYLQTNISIAGNNTLTLTGGTLSNSVSGSGSIVIDGEVVSSVDMAQAMTNINTNASLEISANNIHAATLNNSGLLKLSGGTLSENISTYGNTEISGNVSANADKLNVATTNNGVLNITGGTIAQSIAGTGSIVIDGEVCSNVSLVQNTTVNSDKSLIISASNINSNSFTNNGTLTLTGGTLSHAVTGNGETVISENTVSNVVLTQNTTINAGKSLTVSANNVSANKLTNNGTLLFSGGVLSENISGFGNVQNIGMLSANANYLNADFVNNNTLTLTGGTLTSTNITGNGNILITGSVISNVGINQSLQIAQNALLSINADNILNTISNNGTVALSGGTLTQQIAGNINIIGDVYTSASNLVSDNITNNSNNLTLTGGILTHSITGTGNTVINGNVTVSEALPNTSVSIANNITINSNAELHSNASALQNTVQNNGELYLTGGTIENNIVGGSTIIDGIVNNNAVLSTSTVINANKSLSTLANGIGGTINNAGTLTLTGGTLNHQITGNGVINITDYTYTSANNLLGTGNISNTSTLELTGGTLQQVISGNGNIVINGDVFSSASNLQNNTIISDENTLTLTGGILQKTISASGNGNIVINGNVSTQADNLLASTSLNDGTVLTLNGGTLSTQLTGTGTLAINNNYSVSSSANNIGVDVNNNGYLMLSGGTLSNDITGSGQTIIDGTVINEALISQTMVVNSGKSLTTAASGLGANILNNGNVTLTGGTVNHNITGGGTVTIDGNVENNGNLGLVVINENKSLTTSANGIYGISSNNGNLYLNGGTLGYGVSGNVYITGDVTNTVNQAHSINISNGGTFTTAANLLTNTNAISNSGTLNITSGNLQQNVTGGNTIIAQNATTSATSFGNLELNGVMNVGTNTVNMANADINGTINLGISALNKNSSAYTGGHIIANDITFGDDAILNLTITDTNLQKGDSSGDIEIITANGEWTGDIATFTSNNLYDIAYNTENHTFTFTRKKFGADLITELNGTELDINIAGVWDELQSSDNPNIQTIINAIDYNSQHNATKYAKLIHNLAPQNHQVTVGAVRNANTVIDNHIFTRLATLRRPQINRTNANLRKRRANPFYYYGTYHGRNGGDTEPTTNNGVWVEGLYNYAQQKDDTKFSGNTFGVMGGFDSKLTEHLTAGLGYAFNKTNIDADNHDIDAMGHTGFVYAEYKPTQWYLDALLSYNLTNYQNSVALIDNLTVKSDYKTNSLSGALTSGYDFQKGLDLYGGLNYIGIKQDAYTDTAGQYVKADDTQTLTLKAGGRYKLTSQKMKRASTVLKAAVLYDVMSDDGVTTVTVGNNNYIVHGNGIDPFGVQAGIMFDSFGGNAYLSIGYDLEWRNNFISHTGYIKLKYNF